MTCANCDRPTRDNAYLCDQCIDRAARALGDIPWLDAELETTISKQRASGTEHGSGATEKPLPINPAAHAKREALRAALVNAIRFSSEEGVKTADPAVTIWTDALTNNLIAMSRWMLWRLDGLALNPMGPEHVAAIVSAVKDARRIIDKPPERRYAGPCPECKRDLYHRPDATETKCVGCGQAYDVAEIGEWMRDRLDAHLTGRLVTIHEAQTYLGRFGIEIGRKTVESWARRGRMTPHGDKPRTFRWDEIRDLAIEHAARKGA